MRKSRFFIVMAAGIAVVVLLACLLLLSKDRTGPVITIPANISYREGMTDKELLTAVTAIDNRDGDVSDTLIVKSVIDLSKGNGVKITYAAQDRHNNISEKSVTIYFTGDSNDKPSPDGSDDESLPDETSDDETEETEGDTETPAGDETGEEQTEATDINPEAPVLTLSSDSIEIAKGSDVNWLKYVSDITDDKDDRNTLFKVIMIDGYPDMNTPGEYHVTYRCKDSDGNESPAAVLKVTVTE